MENKDKFYWQVFNKMMKIIVHM